MMKRFQMVASKRLPSQYGQKRAPRKEEQKQNNKTPNGLKKTEAIFSQQMFSIVISTRVVVFIPNVCVHNVRTFVSRTTYAVNRETKTVQLHGQREEKTMHTPLDPMETIYLIACVNRIGIECATEFLNTFIYR